MRAADKQRVDLQGLEAVAEPSGQRGDGRDRVGDRVQVGLLGAARAVEQPGAAQVLQAPADAGAAALARGGRARDRPA